MPVTTAVAVGLRNQLAFGRGLPYTIKNKLLFLGNYSAIDNGKMPNTLGSDWITVAGVSGSETYTCPNTVSYSNADVDNIWFNNPSSIRITTTAELIGYDFTRTFIKYLDSSPNSIEIIAIAKADSVFTQNELYIIQDYFRLSIWWSGALNGHGYLKSNRPLSQNLWLNDLTLDVSTQALLTLIYGAGETPLRNQKLNINTAITSFKTKGYFNKLDAWWVTRNIGRATSKFNWIKNAHHLTEVGTLIYADNVGFKSNGTNSYLRTNYIPATHGVTMTRDSATWGYKNSGELDTVTNNAHGNGAFHSSPSASFMAICSSKTASYMACNNQFTGGSPRVIGYNILSRGDNARYWQTRNKVETQVSALSTPLVNVEMYLCAQREVATAKYFEEVYTEFAIAGGYLTKAERDDIQDIMEVYFANL